MTDAAPIVIDIPDPSTIITSTDGRMFIDMGYLCEVWEEVVSGREFSMSYVKDDEYMSGMVAGQRSMLEDIRGQMDIVSLNASL